jgi:pimeloyl-ACP methyl ester carboxylesterase
MTENLHGTRVSYEIQGEGTSRVILLHGWGCDQNMMQPVADALKDDHQVLLVDFPGHGKSGRPPEPWGVPEYAECLEELLDRTGFTPCSVIAHSFGCRVAAWLEANRDGFFDKIVFTGGAGIRPKPSEEALKRGARYKQLKGYCETAKRFRFLAGQRKAGKRSCGGNTAAAITTRLIRRCERPL